MSFDPSWGLEVFLLATIIDLFLGEPPTAVHPVVRIGKLISWFKKRVQPTRLGGLMVAVGVISVTVLFGHILVQAASGLPYLGQFLGILLASYLLKSTFAIKCLLQTSLDIGRTIDKDIEEARRMLPALVGRNTEELDKTLATSAVIESLSENYVDSILSPIFYYILFQPFGLGLEAALAFKAMSTMDSMLGYKTKGLIDLGFVPAHLDDLANFLPARLSIFLMALARLNKAPEIIGAALRYHAATPSPNSGWPMSAAAGAMGIRLEKPGYYILLPEGREPNTSDVPPAVRFMAIVSAITLAAAVVVMLI